MIKILYTLLLVIIQETSFTILSFLVCEEIGREKYKRKGWFQMSDVGSQTPHYEHNVLS